MFNICVLQFEKVISRPDLRYSHILAKNDKITLRAKQDFLIYCAGFANLSGGIFSVNKIDPKQCTRQISTSNKCKQRKLLATKVEISKNVSNEKWLATDVDINKMQATFPKFPATNFDTEKVASNNFLYRTNC